MRRKSLYLLIIAIVATLLLILGGTQVNADIISENGIYEYSYLFEDGQVKRTWYDDETGMPDGIIIEKYIGENNKNIYIPDTIEGFKVLKIGYNVFQNHSEILSITIPSSVNEIFYEALKISEYYPIIKVYDNSYAYNYVIENEIEYKKIEEKYYEENGFIYTILNSNLASLVAYNGTNTTITVPATLNGYTIIEIGNGSNNNYEFGFSGKIEEITIPETVENVKKFTFNDCNELKSVEIKGVDTVVDEKAFYYSYAQKVTIICPKYSKSHDEVTYCSSDYFTEFEIKYNKISIKRGLKGFEWTGTYTGEEITGKATLEIDDYVLIEGKDYVIDYENNINVGIMKIIITGKGEYLGEISWEEEIKPKSILPNYYPRVEISVDTSNKFYTGKEIVCPVSLKFNNMILIENKDYTIECKNNINPGTATVIITGIGNYTGTIEKTFKIIPKDLSNITPTINTDSKTYTGNAVETSISLKNDSYTLVEGTDYSVTYVNNTNVGTATVIITGIGNYTGTIEKTFKIIPKDLSNITPTINTDSKIYTGNAVETSISLKDGSYTLVEGIDYTVTYKNNINAGTANVTITGIGNYTGTIAKTFKIVAKNLPQLKVTVNTNNKTYTGKAITTSVVLKDGTKTLKKGTDYTVTYKNNTNVGTATVTIAGIGNYTGTITKTFRIVPQKATISSIKNVSNKSAKVTWKKDIQVTGYELYMSTAKADKTYMKTTAKLTLRKSTSTSSKALLKIPKGAKIKVLKKNVKKSRGYTWYKVSYKGKTGYVASKYLETIYYEGKYSKIKTITSNRTTSYTKTKLSKGKKYTFKVRSYKVIDGKKVYGSYSNVKWITIKK